MSFSVKNRDHLETLSGVGHTGQNIYHRYNISKYNEAKYLRFRSGGTQSLVFVNAQK